MTVGRGGPAAVARLDEFPLDTNLIRNRTYTESSASPEAQMKVLAKSLKSLADLAAGAERRRQREEIARQRASNGIDGGGAIPDLQHWAAAHQRIDLGQILCGAAGIERAVAEFTNHGGGQKQPGECLQPVEHG